MTLRQPTLEARRPGLIATMSVAAMSAYVVALIEQSGQEHWANTDYAPTFTRLLEKYGGSTGLSQCSGVGAAAVTLHRSREHLWAQLMQAPSQAGRQTGAMRAWSARRRLVEEVGLTPAPDLRGRENDPTEEGLRRFKRRDAEDTELGNTPSRFRDLDGHVWSSGPTSRVRGGQPRCRRTTG